MNELKADSKFLLWAMIGEERKSIFRKKQENAATQKRQERKNGYREIVKEISCPRSFIYVFLKYKKLHQNYKNNFNLHSFLIIGL